MFSRIELTILLRFLKIYVFRFIVSPEIANIKAVLEIKYIIFNSSKVYSFKFDNILMKELSFESSSVSCIIAF